MFINSKNSLLCHDIFSYDSKYEKYKKSGFSIVMNFWRIFLVSHIELCTDVLIPTTVAYPKVTMLNTGPIDKDVTQENEIN